MGQTIEIKKTAVLDRMLMVESDRTLAGQDGVAFVSALGAGRVNTVAADLAKRLFEADHDIDHVFVMSNSVSIGRRSDWGEDAVASATAVISGLFNFYG